MTSTDGAKPRSTIASEAARRQRRIGWTLTLVLVAVYLAYLLSVVLAPQFMATGVGGNFTLGLACGALAFLTMWLVSLATECGRSRERYDEIEARTGAGW